MTKSPSNLSSPIMATLSSSPPHRNTGTSKYQNAIYRIADPSYWPPSCLVEIWLVLTSLPRSTFIGERRDPKARSILWKTKPFHWRCTLFISKIQTRISRQLCQKDNMTVWQFWEYCFRYFLAKIATWVKMFALTLRVGRWGDYFLYTFLTDTSSIKLDWKLCLFQTQTAW